MTLNSGCKQSKTTKYSTIIADAEFPTIDINTSSELYDSFISQVSKIDAVVLQETEETLFADIDKIVAKNDKYFILDSFGAKTVVSFDHSGKAYAKYGRTGQGPSEYIRPWDIDVDNQHVYILDSNNKKVLKFTYEGDFVDELSIPFIAKSFKVLNNGDLMFYLLPTGDDAPSLCLTDSTVTDIKYCLNHEKGYVGGLRTNDVLRKTNDGVAFYQAPLDTLYYCDQSGNITGGIIFNFGNRKLDKKQQLDFLSIENNTPGVEQLYFTNSPIELKNGYLIGILSDNRQQYIVLIDPQNNKCGAKECGLSKSVYDIIEPCTTDEQGNLICYNILEEMTNAEDFDLLPDSIKSKLTDDYRTLFVYSFK